MTTVLFQAGSQFFLFSTASRSVLRLIQLPTQCTQGLSSWHKVAQVQS